MALSKEVKVGLLALVAGVILYIGFSFLKGVDFFSPTKRYYVVYSNIDGLTISNPVTLNGFTVGRVNNIKIIPERNYLIVVELDINDELQIGDSTLAVLANTDFLGGKSIDLHLGRNSKVYQNGDTLKGFKEKALTDVLGEKAMPILSNLDSTVIKLNHLFGDEMGTSVKNTMHNFEISSHNLKLAIAENRSNISNITSNLSSLTGSLKETEKSVRPLIAKMNMLADSLNDLELKATVAKLNATMTNLNSITEKINKGDGSLGALVNDKALYNDLDKSVKDLDALLLDLKQNPKKYVHFSLIGGGGGKNQNQNQGN